MNDKEYTYDIDKYTIGVDTNGEDGIGMTVAIIKNGEINFLGNCYGENARCLDLLIKENKELKQKYENAVADYETTMFEKEQLNSLVNSCQEEIRQLKKQLEDYKKLGFKHLQDKNNNLETQQREFIKYLEDESKEIYRDGGLRQYIFRQILRKYRSITGVSDENNIK